jgi:hypothetical protein
MISKSPERNTFQKESHIKNAIKDGKELDPDILMMFNTFAQQADQQEVDPAWQKNNMEFDLRTTDWILEKVRTSEQYAQNLYAAMCNNDFIKREMWTILKEQTWSCSWRHAGGIVADMQQTGDYIDWYCSGMGDKGDTGFVSECEVTEEIEADLHTLGWLVIKDTGEH